MGGVLSAGILKTGALREMWTFGGTTLSQYDSILLGCALLVVLLVVTLGQVPSVIGKGERLRMSVANSHILTEVDLSSPSLG